MRVAVSGGTGIVGRFIVDHLQSRGCDVTLLLREGSKPAGFAGPVRSVLAGHSPLTVGGKEFSRVAGQFFDEADAFVHAAFDHQPGRYRGGEGDDLPGFIDANLGGSVRLIEAAQNHGVRRIIVFSSRAVFSPGDYPGKLDESQITNPDTHYGALKVALEAFVKSFAGQESLDIAALRPTGIYGVSHPFERTKWLGLIQDVLSGSADLPVRSATEVHGLDVARAVWLLLTAPPETIRGEIFNCSDVYVSTRAIAEMVQAIAGISGPLPEEVFDPRYGVLCTKKIESLGFRFGGHKLLQKTLKEIVGNVKNSGRIV